MVALTDQSGRKIILPCPLLRVISTVPSQTELLFYLGLDNEIAGITKFCTRPDSKVKTRIKIGGTKQLDIPLIQSLKPDLIIANKEENDQKQIEALMADFPTYLSNPVDLHSALQMINDVGALVNRRQQAKELSTKINKQFRRLLNVQTPSLRAAYLIWQKPYMVAGKDTFIDNMLNWCGFNNVFTQQRYPEITVAMLADAAPDVILLSSEPYPFKQKHADEFAQLLPNAVIKLIDGELFSWYGSRLLYSPEYFISLIDSIKRALNRN